MKKLALLVIFCTIAVSTHAAVNSKTHSETPFSGWSLIAGVGGVIMGNDASSSTEKELFRISTSLPEFSDNLSGRHDVFETNVAGMLGIGYSKEFMSGVVIGLYGTANTNYTSFEENNGYTSLSPEGGGISQNLFSELEMELQNDFAVILKAGLVFDQHTLIYALAGPRWGRFETSLEAHSELTENPGETFRFDLMGEDNHSSYELGYTVGAGVSHAMTEKVIVGLEYAFSNYGDLDTLHINTSCQAPTGNTACAPANLRQTLVAEGKLEANTNVFMATFAYMF